MKKIHAFNGISIAVTAALAGCSTTSIEKAQSDHSDRQRMAEEKLKSFSSLGDSPVSATFVDDYYIVGSKFSPESRRSLPGFFREQYSFNRIDPLTFSEVLSYINSVTNIRIETSHDAAEHLKSLSSSAEEVENLDFEGEELDLSVNVGNLMSEYKAGLVGSDILFTVNFEGTLESFLNHVLGRLNLSWEWKGNYIEVFHTTEKTFVIDSDLAAVGFSAEMEGGAGSNQSFQMQNNMGSLYEEMSSVLENSISDSGKFSISKQLSTVTVVDTPGNLKKIERYINTINENASKQIMLRVQVIDVESNDSGDYGVDWNAAFSGSARGSIGAATPFLPDAGEMFSVSVLDGSLRDSMAGLRALSEKRNVSTTINTNVHTSNGRPVPLQVGGGRDYIRSMSSIADEGVTTTDIDIGTMETGFRLSVLPRINSSGDVAMTLSLDISEGTIDSKVLPDGTEIGLPEMLSRSFIQRAVASNGSPLMLAGFERTTSQSTDSRIGSNISWLLGGRQESANIKVMTIILITPYIMK